jgi:uncharacterized protein
MATRDAFLVNWVKTAYSMEMGLVPVLEKQTTEVPGDPEFRQAIDRHLQQTRKHAELLRDRLQKMGETPTNVKPATPIAAAYGQPDGNGSDRTQQAELLDYVTESFELASYRALKALATQLGDNETSRVCDQILQDEMAMAQALDRRLPGRSGAEAATGAPGESAAGQDNTRKARANFDALNAHDLDRWARDMAPDFRGEAPGMPGEMSREQNRAYLQAYMTAFPDLHFETESVIGSGEQVVVYWVGLGKHTGPMAAPNGMTIPPTGKPVRVKGSTFFEFKGGQISRGRALFDSSDLMRQLGLLPGSATNQAGEPNRDIVHMELPAKDPEAAAEFYHKMFGWDHEHMDGPMNYTTFKTGNVGGGFAEVSEVYEPGGAILYVGSQDIDADLRRAAGFGAKTVVPKTEIPGMGWYAIFADPTGNRFGLFSM